MVKIVVRIISFRLSGRKSFRRLQIEQLLVREPCTPSPFKLLSPIRKRNRPQLNPLRTRLTGVFPSRTMPLPIESMHPRHAVLDELPPRTDLEDLIQTLKRYALGFGLEAQADDGSDKRASAEEEVRTRRRTGQEERSRERDDPVDGLPS